MIKKNHNKTKNNFQMMKDRMMNVMMINILMINLNITI